jgi:hypothetical protein
VGLIDEKTRGRKSRATVPLRAYCGLNESCLMKSKKFTCTNHFHSWTLVALNMCELNTRSRVAKLTGKSFQELATLESIRTQCNSEGKVAKYSRFFRPLVFCALIATYVGAIDNSQYTVDCFLGYLCYIGTLFRLICLTAQLSYEGRAAAKGAK